MKMIYDRFLVALCCSPFLFPTMESLLFVSIGVILICLGAMMFFSRGSTGIKLRLRGLPVNADPDQSIESTLDALMKNSLNDPGAHLLISRLNWWNQMNRFMKTLPENKENLDLVVTSLEVLLRHHQLDQSKVKKDLARVIFDKAIQDPANAHLYAQLCQRLMESKIDWTTDFIHRLFQLVVDEFNRPLVSKESHALKSNKITNTVKLMAALLKRKIPRVSDDWITDVADCLIQRLADNLENSTEHLCLFLKTMLINESDDDCNLLPSQQNRLLPCIQALQEAALNRKNRMSTGDKTEIIKEEDSTSESEDSTDTESETDTDSETESDSE
jgi:hypothetical protein